MSLNRQIIEHLSSTIDKSKKLLSDAIRVEVGEVAKSLGLVRIEYDSGAFYYREGDDIAGIGLVDEEILGPLLEVEEIYCKYIHCLGFYDVWTVENGWENKDE